MYRSTSYSVTGKAPAEFLFGYNIRDKITIWVEKSVLDKELSLRDFQRKQKGKEYADLKGKRVTAILLLVM